MVFHRPAVTIKVWPSVNGRELSMGKMMKGYAIFLGGLHCCKAGKPINLKNLKKNSIDCLKNRK
jgi:hypothetical protein